MIVLPAPGAPKQQSVWHFAVLENQSRNLGSSSIHVPVPLTRFLWLSRCLANGLSGDSHLNRSCCFRS